MTVITLASSLIILTSTNHTYLTTDVNPQSISRIIEDISKTDEKESYYLYINSGGGSVFAALPLINLLDVKPNVICIADFAMSMAFSIFQACPKRIVLKNSILMQHQISASFKGSLKELEGQTETIKSLTNLLNTQQAFRLDITVEKFTEKVKFEWWFIGADYILKNKAADILGQVTCSKELAEKKVKIAIPSFAGRVDEKEVSACPIGRIE